MSKPQGRIRKDLSRYDLVRHLYSRRVQWGLDTMLLRRGHPMEWKKMTGNYQNWEVKTAEVVPSDYESPYGEPMKLFYNDDMTVGISRRRESMPYFFRNCDADELHFVNRGNVVYETDFGNLNVGERELVLIPKGVTYRALVEGSQETLRIIFESRPEIFVVPLEMVEHIYGRGRAALGHESLHRPVLSKGQPLSGEFEVRVKYHGGFSDFLGEVSSIIYDNYPLDAEIIDGEVPVFKFSLDDVEKLGTTPVAFLAGAYLDNKNNRAWSMHITGGGVGSAPVHRNPDSDELRYVSSGPNLGNFLFTPQGVDHGGGRGYTRKERNRGPGPYDIGDSISAYTIRPLKGTAMAQRFAKPYPA